MNWKLIIMALIIFAVMIILYIGSQSKSSSGPIEDNQGLYIR